MSEETARPTFSTNDKPSGLHGALPYRPQGSILSEGERRFYLQGLRPAVGKRYKILMKVRLTDVLQVPPELWRSGAGRKVQQRHVDFLLVSKCRFKIVAAIELDDATHLEPEQQAKDAYLDDALLAAGVPNLRFPIYKRYDPKRIRRMIIGGLKRHPARKKRLTAIEWG